MRLLRHYEHTARRRHEAARLIGAAAVGILGQFAVDMPGGYFGGVDELTRHGLWYSIGIAAVAVAGAAGLIFLRRGYYFLLPLVATLNVGIFLAPLASDPVVAGGVILWNLMLGSGAFFPMLPPARRFSRETPYDQSTEGAWLVRNGPAARHLVVLALLAAIVVVGFQAGRRAPALAVCGILDLLVLSLTLPWIIRLIRTGSRLAIAASVFLPGAAWFWGNPSAAIAILAGYHALVLVLLLARQPVFRELLDHFYSRPAMLLLVSFMILIGTGTLFLSFPAASATGVSINPMDALFTATSASCVTGLIVLDTPHAFSTFGHIVILLLIQAGGLNIMVLSAFAALLVGRAFGIRGERALGDVLDLDPAASAYRLIRFIVLFTLAAEAVGAVLLWGGFQRHGYTQGQAAWNGVFHSVSSFCNAGFSLRSDSLMGFRNDPGVLLTIASLIVLGGIGYAVLAYPWLRRRGRYLSTLRLQMQVVLIATGTLIAAGTAWFLLAEWNGMLAGLSPASKVLNALFQSVTLRTAGFNSVDIAPAAPATVLVMMAFMYIGASPGGTGGGIKTTTAVVLLGSIPAIASGRARIQMGGRSLATDTVFRGAAVAVTSLLVLGAGAILLVVSQPQAARVLLFEAGSAFGTVGLSLGATPNLDVLGKAVLVGLMVAGRIGPLSLVLLLGRKEADRIQYPDVRLMVG